MKRLLVGMTLVAAIGPVGAVLARTWTSSNGRFTVDAELVNFQDGKAELKRADGRLIRVPLVALSDDDRAFVKQQYPGVQEEQFRPAPNIEVGRASMGSTPCRPSLWPVSRAASSCARPTGASWRLP